MNYVRYFAAAKKLHQNKAPAVPYVLLPTNPHKTWEEFHAKKFNKSTEVFDVRELSQF